jgi:hypothetical protein
MGGPGRRIFVSVSRSWQWLPRFLLATIFVLAFSIDFAPSFASSKEAGVAVTQLHRPRAADRTHSAALGNYKSSTEPAGIVLG